jgi:chemotaxis response regulator CheB
MIAARMELHFPKERWPDLARGLKTAGETYFFRDPESFEALRRDILPPPAAKHAEEDRDPRLWSAGCCTGEEAYSLAITRIRNLPELRRWNVSILATDINPKFLVMAQAGVYSEWSFRGASAWSRERFFSSAPDKKLSIDPSEASASLFPMFKIEEIRRIAFYRKTSKSTPAESWPGLALAAPDVAAPVRANSLALARAYADQDRLDEALSACRDAVSTERGLPVIARILPDLRPAFPAPTLVAQHMSMGFSAGFADWHYTSSSLSVHLARGGELPLPGHVYIAPDDRNLRIGLRGELQTAKDEARHGGLLTGMGDDGAEELKIMTEIGALTVVQDEESCVVFGMPAEAIKLGAASFAFPPKMIAGPLNTVARRGARNRTIDA